MSDYLVFRVAHMTCGYCGDHQPVRIRLHGDIEIMPGCRVCGRTGWLDLPCSVVFDPPVAVTLTFGAPGEERRALDAG